MSSIKAPKALEMPKAKSDIDVNFVNRYFSYQERLAKYNYANDKTDENKEKVDRIKQKHKDWLDYVSTTYGDKVRAEKTKEILKKFSDTYFPDIPEKKNLGKFR